MRASSVAAFGAGATVLLAAVSGALINELHGGWQWWIAAGVVVLVSASVSTFVVYRTHRSHGGDVLGPGAVKAEQDIVGAVKTFTTGGPFAQPSGSAEGDRLGPGAVKAGRHILGDVTTVTSTPPDAKTDA